MPFEPADLALAHQQWRKVLGGAGVRVDPTSLERFQQATMCSPAYARVVIAPRSTEQVSACMAIKTQPVADFVPTMERHCRQQQMPCPVTLTSLSSRAIDCTVPLLFDRQDAQASDRAHECYRQLFAQGKTLGVLPYRVPARFMHLLTDSQGPAWQLRARIKAALDPDNLLSPGRYCAASPTPDQSMTASVVSI